MRSNVVFALAVLVSCSKSVPSEIKPTLDSIRDDARKVADAAAKTCGDEYASGQFYATAKGCGVKLLPGQTVVPVIPSPAKGTPLDTNPNVAEVITTCWLPQTSNESCGDDLGTLRHAFGPGDFQSGNWKTAEDTCKKSPTSCEKVEVPSRYVKNPQSADLTIVRPTIGGPPGSTAMVRVVLGKK